MKNRNILMTGLVALALTIISVAGASAQWGPRGPQGGGPGGGFGGPGWGFGGPGGLPIRELNLTEEQKTKIRTIFESSMDGGEAVREQMHELQDQRRAIVASDVFNAEAARELATREAALSVAMNIKRMETENAIYNVLTPEQKAKLAELEKNRPAGPPQGRRGSINTPGVQ
jgi:periplasmic protein CpxP/Spy